MDKGATSSKARKRAREQAAPPSELAGSVPQAMCWSLLAQVLDEPSAEGWAVLGRVLESQGAAVVVGDVMRRERPLLLEELAAHGQWALVTKVLHHKTHVQVPERGLVGVIKTALYSGMKVRALPSPTARLGWRLTGLVVVGAAEGPGVAPGGGHCKARVSGLSAERLVWGPG